MILINKYDVQNIIINLLLYYFSYYIILKIRFLNYMNFGGINKKTEINFIPDQLISKSRDI